MEKHKEKLSLEQFVTSLLIDKYEEYSKMVDDENKIIDFHNKYKNMNDLINLLIKNFKEFNKISAMSRVIMNHNDKALWLNNYMLEGKPMEGIEGDEYYDYERMSKDLKSKGYR